MSGLSVSTVSRVRVLDIRQRLESVAVNAFDDACRPGKAGKQNQISNRLAFILVTRQETTPLEELYGLLGLARHAYAKTSDVLHGRGGMVNVPPVMIDEWEATVRRLEAIEEQSSRSVSVGDAA
ncbi:hypothetical protein [Cryobacterium sp. W22_MBD10_FK3]|uniref:hypothetical protein n=1 Tax=Cryobacterium sp. W22_MBD10_FK3 TaxID=3240273 RepID=UPI003F8F01DB